jgi:WD40 repeat protein
MELVKGIPITRFCDDNQLTPRQRLELFIPVCQAVQHAHTKGIIHRDLKPSNVLVALYDDQPVPKVIDFGVAKATSQKLTERTLFTAFGSFLGTLEYMSPEQAKLNALDIDTRSDVYALGVLLYELLTGNTPLEHERLKQTALDELLRTIREEEPPRPSTRLSNAGEALATISARRGTEPAKLGQVLRGELDWIVMKALEKERTRRYETANGLVHDLQRYLADEPVEACPPTAGYKLRKFARKHKKLLATTASFAALLLLGVTASTWQAVRATQAETLAVAERDEKEQARQAEAEQRSEAQQQRDDAQKQRDEVRALNERLQGTLYIADMNLARHAWEDHNVARVLKLLEKYRPKPGETDLRHFEWHYLNKLCHPELLTLQGHTNGVASVAYSPDGKRLASASADKTVKVWDTQTGQALHTLQGHTGRVWSVAYSPDGKRLTSMSDDRTVKVWDTQTGKELRSLQGSNVMVLSPDCTRLASEVGITMPGFPRGSEVKVWDMQTGQELFTLKGHTGIQMSVAFSPDGKRLASASGEGAWAAGPNARGGTVKLWDAQTGQELFTLKGHSDWVGSIAFSPDGKRLASSSADQTVKVWDVQTGKQLFTWKATFGGLVYSPDGKRLTGRSGKVLDAETGEEQFSLTASDMVVFSPDGKRLAGKLRGDVKVWDAQTGQELHSFRGHAADVHGVVFSPDGKRLASASVDKTVKVWDVQRGQELPSLKTTNAGMENSVVFSPDGQRLASALEANSVKVWNAQTGQPLLTLKRGDGGGVRLAFSPDSKLLAIATANQTAPGEVKVEVKVCDAQTGEELHTLKGPTGRFLGGAFRVVFSPDGKRLASSIMGRPSSEVKVWDVQTGKELYTIAGEGPVFSPDGKRLASSIMGRPSSEVKVWDAQTGQELHTFKGHTSRVRSVAFSPDGKHLASAANGLPYQVGGEVKVWDAQTGKELRTLQGDSWGLAFSPDGKRLASASEDKTVKVWDAQSGQELHSLEGHSGSVLSVAFSPDGQRLASGSRDTTIKIWDVLSGQETLTLKGHTGAVNAVFTPDGKRLISLSAGEVKIWNATPLPAKP